MRLSLTWRPSPLRNCLGLPVRCGTCCSVRTSVALNPAAPSFQPVDSATGLVSRGGQRSGALAVSAQAEARRKKKPRGSGVREKSNEKETDSASLGPEGSAVEYLPRSPDPADGVPAAAAEATAEPSAPPLPTVGREQILNSCFNVSLGLGTAGMVGRTFSDVAATKGYFMDGHFPNWAAALPFPSAIDEVLALHMAAALGAATAVSLGRVALMKSWPEFKAATDASNRQVLTPLAGSDLLQVSALPAAGEEILFRGLLLPAVGMDWRGVLVAGVVFGVLHIPGGRNPAFGVWASTVGCLYGALAVYTHDLAAPILAHTAANLFSAVYWRSTELEAE